jgi:hypothetical protein
MKRLFFVLLLIILLSTVIIIGQPQLEDNINDDFRNATNVAKKIVAWFFAILIVIFGIGATAMNLSRKNKKTSISDEP